MSLEAARSLSVPELLRVLNEKLGLEHTRLRKYHPPAAVSTTSLEAEIKSLETRAHDVLRLIPSLQNLLRPVNRLPPEILSYIARCVLHKNNVSNTRSIIPLTHVCRYWRESIISVPTNWALISNTSKDLAALSLERAKAAALEVHLNVDRDDPGFVDLLTPYTQNIGTLRFTSFATIEKLRRALPEFPQSTPNLRSLTLNSAVHWDRSTDPFESLASTLGCLNLYNIPLYPSMLCLRSLTQFSFFIHEFDLHLDTLLDFLEENRLLERAFLGIRFKEASLRSSRRRTAMGNRLRFLSIYCHGTADSQAIISSIALQRGAHLNITLTRWGGQLNDILSGVSTTHLLNLSSPTFIEYRSYPRSIQLSGPNGKFSSQTQLALSREDPFVELPLLPLAHVREFRLIHRLPEKTGRTLSPLVLDQSSFPALEILAVNCETSVSHLFSALFSNPSSPPALKTLAFMDCDLTKNFMEELTQYASKRKDTTSAWLYKVVIVHTDGVFPSLTAIRKLREHVSVVDVRIDTKLPGDLS